MNVCKLASCDCLNTESGAEEDVTQTLVVDHDSGSAKQLSTSVRGFKGERIIKALTKVEEKKTKRMSRQEQVCFFICCILSDKINKNKILREKKMKHVSWHEQVYFGTYLILQNRRKQNTEWVFARYFMFYIILYMYGILWTDVKNWCIRTAHVLSFSVLLNKIVW